MIADSIAIAMAIIAILLAFWACVLASRASAAASRAESAASRAMDICSRITLSAKASPKAVAAVAKPKASMRKGYGRKK